MYILAVLDSAMAPRSKDVRNRQGLTSGCLHPHTLLPAGIMELALQLLLVVLLLLLRPCPVTVTSQGSSNKLCCCHNSTLTTPSPTAQIPAAPAVTIILTVVTAKLSMKTRMKMRRRTVSLIPDLMI
jgi:hypothetical protein